MFKHLAALAVLGIAALPAVVSAADINDGITEEQMFGIGSAGSLPPMPDCPKSTYYSLAEDSCLPTSLPLPEGTVALATDATCPVSTDLETAFTTSSEMKTLLECILPKAVDWLTYEYGDASLTTPAEWGSQSGTLLPLDFIYVPAGTLVEEPEGGFQHCGGYDSTSALHYCPQDGNIYLGEELLWFTYNEFGDADMWGSISHEIGHRIQHVAGGMKADPAVPNEAIPAENQADCFSGAFMDFAARYGYIDVSVTGDDIVDLFSGLFHIGEADSGQRTHGTIDQRIRAFFVGYNSDDSWGVFDCDRYLTDVTIIPARFLQDAPTSTDPATPSTTAAAPTTTPAPTTTTPAPTTTTLAPTTTVPPTAAPTTQSTLPPTSAPPTTSSQPTTADPAGIGNLDQVMTVCVGTAVDAFNARVAETSDPDRFPAEAQSEGVELTVHLSNLLHESYFKDSETPSIIVMEPYQRSGEGQDAPFTSWGLLNGEMLECMLMATQIPEDLLQHYLDTSESSAEWGTWKLDWFFDTLEEGGPEFYFVQLSGPVQP